VRREKMLVEILERLRSEEISLETWIKEGKKKLAGALLISEVDRADWVAGMRARKAHSHVRLGRFTYDPFWLPPSCISS